MPELPEVEITCRGIKPHIIGTAIKDIVIRNRNLRWPITYNLKKLLQDKFITNIKRRAKYLLIYTDTGCLIIHLGMSGSLRVIKDIQPHGKHDHVDIIFKSGYLLRFRDPRRFGALLWTKDDPNKHKLIVHLGPEPLSDTFNTEYLYAKSRQRKQAIKTFIMNNQVVVGVGNIYANEALFLAGINPRQKAGKISKSRYKKLTIKIKHVLKSAIKEGGTTLRDFFDSNGNPGYFGLDLKVYGRTSEPCINCKNLIKVIRLSQRSTFYCPSCQK